MPRAAQVQKLLEADSGGGRSRRRGTIRRMGTQRLALGGRGAAKRRDAANQLDRTLAAELDPLRE